MCTEMRVYLCLRKRFRGKGWIIAIIVVLAIFALFVGGSDCRVLPETMDKTCAKW